MSNQINPHKEKHSTLSNIRKEFSMSLTNKKHIDLFSDNKSIKIPANKLVQRSQSKQSTKENKIKENKDTKRNSNDKDKNMIKNKEIFNRKRKDDKLSSKTSISSWSKTKSHKTEQKCESKHRNSSDNKTTSNENKILRLKMKETQPMSKDKHLHLDKFNVSKFDSKSSKIYSNLDRLKETQDVYIPKKITERRKSYHDDNVSHNDEVEDSIFKRRNSHTSSKTTCLESDKKLNILQNNKQLSANYSQSRKRSTSSSDAQSEKENSKKHSSEKSRRSSLNCTKTADSKKDTNNENKFGKKLDTNEYRKRSYSEFSLLNNELDLRNESKRPKANNENNSAFSAFSSLDDNEVIAIDKTQILPPVNDSNSPYVSFGDFLKNKSLPLVESSPSQGPEFSCTQLGDKILIKKKIKETKAIVIDITDDYGDDETNNAMQDDNDIFSKTTPKKDFNAKKNIITNAVEKSDVPNIICKKNTHEITENSPKITQKKDLDVKIKNCDNKIIFDGEHLNNSPKCAPGSNYKKKTQKITESFSKMCSKKGSESNKTNTVENLDNVASVDERKKYRVTESSSKISPKKHCDDKMKSSDNKTSLKERLDNNHESSSDSNNKKSAQSVTESSSKISPKKDSYNTTESPEKKSNVDSLNNNHDSSSDSTQKKTTKKDNESSPKRDCDVKIKSSSDNKKVGKSSDINKDCSLIETKKFVNSKPDKHNLQILFTEQAVEYISSDFVSVLNVYIDYKKYTEKLLMSKGTDNKEVNNKDYFNNHRSKFLKILCKKLQNAKVYNFKLGYFFDSLIESIKIHIAAKEILNEKTINRFIHNVLILFSENCSSPDDHYMLYNHVVSVKSLQYLDQKSFGLSDCVDKHIFDCMNSFSVKLERYKEPSNSRNKDTALPLLFCVDDAPDKITDITPGNSLPCINTGENLVARISPIRSSDVDKIPQISIADTNNEKDNKEEDLIDLLQNVPFDVSSINHVAQLPLSEKNTNNQPAAIEKLNNDALTESIVSELHALFYEKESVIQNTNEINLIKSPNMNYETSPSISDETINKCATLHRTEIVNSPKSDYSDSMNFLKNINQNKSFLAPIFSEKNINTTSSISYSESFNSVTNPVVITSTSTSTPVAINKDTSNKNIKVLHNIVVLPATKQTFDPIISENICSMPETNKSSVQIEIASSSRNEITNALSVVSPQASQTIASPDNLLKTLDTKEKNKLTKRPYVRRKPLSERKKRSVKEIGSQLPKVNPLVETSTALPRPFPTANIQNDTFVSTNVAMDEYLNSKVANTLENSSYMMNQIPQQFNLQPKTNVAPIQLQPTIPSYLPHRQYSDPVQAQQTAPVVHPSTQTSRSQPQTNSVPLFWQMNAPSQLPEPPPAPLMSRSSSYLPPLMSKNPSVISPPQQTRSQQSYFPNLSTTETLNRSSYTSSIGASPMNLQSSVPHGQMTQLVALQQVIERTLVQRIETVRTQQNPNVPQYLPNPNVLQYGPNSNVLQYDQNVYQRHLEEMDRRFRYQKAEQERLNEQLRQQEMLRLRQYQQEVNRVHHQQEMHRLQRAQERMNPDMYFQYKNNNQNKATMYNSNNCNSVPSGQIAQSKPNQYTYSTYLMPQLINNSANVNGGIVSYMNNQQTMQNESRRNNIPTAASSSHCTENNNLVYPHTTYPRANINSHQNSTANNSVQAAINQTVRNPNIVPIRDNTVPSVSHTSVIVRNNASSSVTQHNVSSNATRSFSQQLGNEQMLRADTAVNRSENNDKQNEAQRNKNSSLEQHLTELEELINDSDSRVNKEMDNIGVRNSSRDSGYMTPTKQFQKDQTCAFCLGVGNFVCSGCVNVYYCSEVCQKKAWPSHQKNCF